MDPKEVAAVKALEFVRDGMTVGLGTGSTSTHFIKALGQAVHENGWRVRGVPTSERSGKLAAELGIPIVSIAEAKRLDVAVDGADEADAGLRLIKGGGGALLREKLIAAAADEFIVICDDSKFKQTLGVFPLPIAVVPFAWQTTARRLARLAVEPRLRMAAEGTREPYVTDDGLYILDMSFGTIDDPVSLEREIKQITGVVDVGLFVGIASQLILGYADGHTEIRLPAH